MLKRFLIVYVFLFSYAGAIAHSIVPHHHHVSHKEAKEHHHHNHASHSHGEHDGSKKEQSQEGAYFLTHASNTDVVVNHFSFDNPIKGKKLQFSVQVSEPLLSLALSDHNIFHPPPNDRLLSIAVFYSRSLRAPPFFVV
jgi:hypothetical protein